MPIPEIVLQDDRGYPVCFTMQNVGHTPETQGNIRLVIYKQGYGRRTILFKGLLKPGEAIFLAKSITGRKEY